MEISLIIGTIEIQCPTNFVLIESLLEFSGSKILDCRHLLGFMLGSCIEYFIRSDLLRILEELQTNPDGIFRVGTSDE